MPARCRSHLRRMQSSTDPADRTGTIGGKASTPPTGPASRLRTTRPTPSSASRSRTPGRSWRTGRPTRTAPAASPSSTAPYAPRRGWTRTGPDGDVSMGLAGSWAAGAVQPVFDRVTTGRAAIFTAGRPVHLPHHRDSWRWKAYAVDRADVEAARQQPQHLLGDAEADTARTGGLTGRRGNLGPPGLPPRHPTPARNDLWRGL